LGKKKTKGEHCWIVVMAHKNDLNARSQVSVLGVDCKSGFRNAKQHFPGMIPVRAKPFGSDDWKYCPEWEKRKNSEKSADPVEEAVEKES